MATSTHFIELLSMWILDYQSVMPWSERYIDVLNFSLKQCGIDHALGNQQLLNALKHNGGRYVSLATLSLHSGDSQVCKRKAV